MNKHHRTAAKIAGAALLTAAVAVFNNAAPANADAHTHDEYLVCAQLDANPTFAGIEHIASAMLAQMDVNTAASTVIDAVTYVCPQYSGLVDAWANAHSSGSKGSAA